MRILLLVPLLVGCASTYNSQLVTEKTSFWTNIHMEDGGLVYNLLMHCKLKQDKPVCEEPALLMRHPRRPRNAWEQKLQQDRQRRKYDRN